jgi:hypothetical protein
MEQIHEYILAAGILLISVIFIVKWMIREFRPHECAFCIGKSAQKRARTMLRSVRLRGCCPRNPRVTIRKATHTVIATRCIENKYHLLHNDRDFGRFARRLGLRVVE